MLMRCNGTVNSDDNDETATTVTLPESSDPPEDKEPTLQEQLEMAMKASVVLTTSQEDKESTGGNAADKQLTAAVKAEMALFETNGERGRCLQMAYDYLMSVPPTSVEAERAFSAAGTLCTKLRSRLNDRTLDSLCCLRAYYQQQPRGC